MDEEQSERGAEGTGRAEEAEEPRRTQGCAEAESPGKAEGPGRADGPRAGQDAPEQPDPSTPKQPDPAAPENPAAAPVHHNRVNQYFYGALDAPGAHFGIGAGDSASVRRRAVGRLDAGEADALLAPYVEPGCFEEAAAALEQDGVVVLVGPPGIGKRSAAVALVAKAAEGTEYVVLSPGRSLEDLADGRRMTFGKGVGYVLIDRMHEAASGTTDFDWRRVRDAVRDAGAHLVITTVHPVEGDAPGSVRHVPWELPDLAAVLRVRLLRARCAADTVERAAAGLPEGCGVAEVAEAAERIARGADPDEVWQEYGSGAAEPVRDWFVAGREPHEWVEVTTLAFVTGVGYRDFETCQERLEEWVAPTFPTLANDEETASAHRRDADRRLSLGRNTLVAVEERKDGALTRGALVFAHPHYRQWALQELWAKRSTAYWNGVRDWLTELVGTRPGLGVQLSVASGLALLTRPAFDEVAENYLHPWAGGAAGPEGQSTAVLVLQFMCLDEGLAATALAVGRDWARSPDPALRSAAAAAFSGALGVRFPTDAVNVLLRLTGRSEEAAPALAGLVALLLECGEDTGAVLRPLAYRLRALRTTLTGRHKETVLDTVRTLLGARDPRTGRLVGASLLDGDPAQSDRIAELWAGVLENRPRRGWALRFLHATLRDLTAVTAGPEPAAERFGRSLGAALAPGERQHLATALRRTAVRPDPETAALTETFLTAVLSTED
ncbi:hypothetical protein [Streptomyces sp. NRRL S-37]|uniref:nSTAND3 domain-containing NTPase n=1 Tax=Streptomyces sp. NRRL S-37 TaxID=1463903 RepID=UPI00068C7DD2|nr:hypothetical protein [Streptomyces sp. NRRL S-37]